MAAMVKLLGEINGIVEDVYRGKNEAEQSREIEYYSALKIQAWYRGTRTRSYMKHLRKCATYVQKLWRGYLGREYFRVLIKNNVFIMKLNYYNAMATKIQKVWRGYYVRKYVDNFYARKRYMEALAAKNAMIRNELSEFAEQQAQASFRMEELAFRRRQEYLARKNHYLVSTEVMPGVYNSPFLPYMSEQEMILRSVKPLMHKKKRSKGFPFDPAAASYDLPKPTSLPPLPVKPQGPFREPADVQKQRYKPFQPSLRVSTDFYSLDKARQAMRDQEWITRLNDDVFQPFTKTSSQYQPLMHSQTPYGHPPYGSKFFREEFPDKHISAIEFKTLVQPIPVFEKFNDTYSMGQV